MYKSERKDEQYNRKISRTFAKAHSHDIQIWVIHVSPWLIHVNVWQKQLQYCKVISLQLIKINGKKKDTQIPSVHEKMFNLLVNLVNQIKTTMKFNYVPPESPQIKKTKRTEYERGSRAA